MFVLCLFTTKYRPGDMLYTKLQGNIKVQSRRSSPECYWKDILWRNCPSILTHCGPWHHAAAYILVNIFFKYWARPILERTLICCRPDPLGDTWNSGIWIELQTLYLTDLTKFSAKCHLFYVGLSAFTAFYHFICSDCQCRLPSVNANHLAAEISGGP